MTQPIPDYKNLDLRGEALQAAMRMEARAQEQASEAMFQQLVVPLLTESPSQVKRVCEFGCGTAALARRIARFAPEMMVCASDKSAGMLGFAQRLIEQEGLTNLHLYAWDVLDEAAYPFPTAQFDLIISSVVIPYFDDDQAVELIAQFAAHLAPGGVLAFMEQDWMSDTVNYPGFDQANKVIGKDHRVYKQSLGLGLRPMLRRAGLELLPRRSFLWSDDAYGPYTRDLLERFADSAYDRRRITVKERDEWKQTLNKLAASGDFFYGMVYHLVAGRQAEMGR